jgi:hypothetical protein
MWGIQNGSSLRPWLIEKERAQVKHKYLLQLPWLPFLIVCLLLHAGQ